MRDAFLQGVFDNGDVVDLAAHVEMEQAQFLEKSGVA